MELTIEQALQQGVAAHKEGKLQEAERLYRAILQSQPLHPDANHNLGVLAVSANKFNVSLPLFKTALEANLEIEQFWFSYIDALIKDNKRDVALQVLEDAKKKGVTSEKLKVFEGQLISEFGSTNSAIPSKQQLDILLNHYQNGRFEDAEKLALSLTTKFPQHLLSWQVLGDLFGQTGRHAEAYNAHQTATALSPLDANSHSKLGVTLLVLGRLDEAEASYRQAIALKPDFADAHNNLGLTLKKQGKLTLSMEFYKKAIQLNPDLVAARINLNTVSNSAVPKWHISMMNDKIRNDAYFDAINLAVEEGSFVLEIGTGSGLLSLIAASSGAGTVITCETSKTIADNANEIIETNGYKNKISVINKKSTDLIIGKDLPERADLIISEILSGEFVGEGIRPTLIDANKRLLKSSGKIIPQSGKIKICLIGNSPEISDVTIARTSHGFDLSNFNSISQQKFSLHLKNKPVFLSNPQDAFNINLGDVSTIRKEQKSITLKANSDGVCIGLIQWLWVHLYGDIEYENKPGEIISHWPTPIYLFEEPIDLKKGDIVEVRAFLGEDSVWFYKKATNLL